MDNKPLLSICIPTYNRAPFLDECLKQISSQITNEGLEDTIELLVSDNHSTDDTPDIVKKHIQAGAKIRYFRNEKNLGMDGNFVNCFKNATGNFIWLLGDDDYLMKGALKLIVEQLGAQSIGLVHLKTGNHSNGIIEYSNAEKFLCDVSFWITFISGNIVNSKFIQNFEFEKYAGTLFSQVPLYMTAANSSKKNVLIDYPILDGGKDAKNNGGYNLYEVFIKNYLGIWKEQMNFYPDFKKIYAKEKINIFRGLIVNRIIQDFILQNNGNFKKDGAFRIILNYYGGMPQAWYYLIKECATTVLRKLGF